MQIREVRNMKLRRENYCIVQSSILATFGRLCVILRSVCYGQLTNTTVPKLMELTNSTKISVKFSSRAGISKSFRGTAATSPKNAII